MKLLIASEFKYGQIGRSFQKGFAGHGVEIDAFDLAEEYQKTPLAKNKYVSRLFRTVYAEAMSRQLCLRMDRFDPDILFITKGQWIKPWALAEFHKKGKKILNFYTDDPFEMKNSSQWVHRSFPVYDVFFTFAKHLMPRLIKAGCRKVEYLPFARDPELHAPWLNAEDLSPYTCDVCFIGNIDEVRLHWLQQLKRVDLKIWGGTVNSRRFHLSGLESKMQAVPLYGTLFSKAMAACKIALNLMRMQNAHSHNMRTYEAAACGAFVLSERTPEVVELFKEDVEAAYFSTPEELLRKIDYYLKHAEERKRIARAGWERVKDDTYSKRAERVLDVCRGLETSEAVRI